MLISHRLIRGPFSVWGFLLAGWFIAVSDSATVTAAELIDFNRQIRPILSDNCYACHGPDAEARKAGLRLDEKTGAFSKLDSGHYALVAGKTNDSRILRVIALPSDHEDAMPPAKTGKKLTAPQVELLRLWVEQGAPWATHWSYATPERPALPPVKNTNWLRNDIDRFTLAKLDEKGLAPNAEADRSTLVRRATLDLTGLPPTLAEVDAFLADKNADAYETLVDRLLSSPHYGERMALAWLDYARYADTAGYHFDGFRQMHLWRDWVIEAFNDDKSFDQFTIEQIAGDLLPDATVDQKIATGFHRNVMTNDEGGADPDEYLAKYMVDRVSTTAQVWLGTTLACAECHDHKYDPLSQKEFYQFYSFFHNVAEKGLDGTRIRNPAPILKVPSRDQSARLVRYLDQIPGAEKVLSEREGQLPKAQLDWEKTIRNKPPETPVLAGEIAAFTFDQTLTPSTNASTSLRASYSAGEPTWVEGKIGQALQLEGGTNHYVSVENVPALVQTNGLSYGGWIKLNHDTGAVLSQMEPAPRYRGYDLLVMKGKLEVHLVNRFPENAIKVTTKDAIKTGVWTHVFVTWNGSNKAEGVKIYVDGVARPLDVPNNSLSASIDSDTPLLIGTRTNAFPFKGALDDLRLFHRTLAASEVAQLAAYGQLLLAQIPSEQRTEEQQAALKLFFRQNHATAFLQAQDRLATLRREKDDLMARIPDTMVMDEMEKPRDTFVLVRGNFQQKGMKVTAATPACWPPLPAGQPANRLGLAYWLVATNNPLTARVTVNRYWGMFFGTGLVKTSNDFGSQGDRPTHPELLDWLACEFMRPQAMSQRERTPPSPWAIKHMVRLIVTSATYRQSAHVTPDKLERDPYNQFVTRGPRLRLEAELIRDQALAVSGLMNPKIGGPSIKPYQPPGIWDGTDHKYEQSKGADLYRRGLYVFWKRAAHYPSFATFDAPSRETCTVSRPRTSTPLQSLVLMNDPVYVEAARALAARVLLSGGSRLSDQLTYAFRLTLARAPHPDELKVLEKTYRQQHGHFAADPKAAEGLLSVGESPLPAGLDAVDLAAMTGVANVLLNLNETLTK